MAVQPQPLFEPTALIGGPVKRLFTASLITRIDKFTVSNPFSTADAITVWLVPSGSMANQSNQIINSRPIQINETWDAYPVAGHYLEPGDAIYASCTTELTLFCGGTVVSS